jgi:methylase of polypeptide subunit release factors
MREEVDFGGLTISFDHRVLRPRAWTVAQSEWAAELMVGAPGGTVLELCSGAGHIGLLAVAASGRRLLCVDASGVACDFTRANAVAAGIADRVQVREGLLEEALHRDEVFPVIIADPPWVPRGRTGEFAEDPLLAIDGGPDGLDVARACMTVIADHLAPGGSAVLQLGTLAQAHVLRGEHCDDNDLVMVDVRQEQRGVLARIDRA